MFKDIQRLLCQDVSSRQPMLSQIKLGSPLSGLRTDQRQISEAHWTCGVPIRITSTDGYYMSFIEFR